LGRLTGVSQNAQSSNPQTRTFAYDLVGRLTSETHPESGTTTYVYDTDSTCGTSSGDRVKKTDAVGNVSCYAYDSLHRPTAITYPSGSYAAVTLAKHFVYDSATVNSQVMSNVKTRLAEAYTCTSSCTTKLTDTGLSYTVRGEPSDAWQSTPNSGGYYHVSEQFWANGAIKQISGLSSLPTFTFNADGEGRVYQVSASSGQNPVTNTVFNAASLTTSVTYGSGDADSFSYDPNTNRLTQYQFTVNGQSEIGALTWNANHTLQSLDITDPFNSSDAQNCAFSHDDLSRLASINCGTPWSQTFSYDAFGNISKSGTYTFQPIYKNSSGNTTNQFVSIPGATVSYDANGNVVTDGSHTYAWDSSSKAITVDSVNATYDALGRMVEQNRSGTYTQLVYGPHGGKFAIMSGQTLQKGLLPLPGGAIAAYNSSGLLYYGHPDHLGSIRLGSTPSKTIAFDIAYAPFGETYAASGTTDPAFTGQRQDTVAGLYDFPARQYSTQGRWPAPDPAGLRSMHLSDPQTLNRYAYARNNPLAFVDPMGLDSEDECGDDDGVCGDGSGNGGGGGGGDVCGIGSLCLDNGNLVTSMDQNDLQIVVTASLSDGTEAAIETQNIAITDTLQGSILGQMADSTQCSDCMSILSGANTVVQASGWAEIGLAGIVSGGFALDAVGSLGGTLTPTLETANSYMDALGLTDNVLISDAASFGSTGSSMTMQGNILLSQGSFASEGQLVSSLAEESVHLSQQAAMIESEGAVYAEAGGTTLAQDIAARNTAKLIWEIFRSSSGIP
jgi:RHS repeat-associated protein